MLKNQMTAAYIIETILILNIFTKFSQHFKADSSDPYYWIFERAWIFAPLILCAWIFYILIRNANLLSEPDKMVSYIRYQEEFWKRFKIRSDIVWVLLSVIVCISMMAGFVSVRCFLIGSCAAAGCGAVFLFLQVCLFIRVNV